MGDDTRPESDYVKELDMYHKHYTDLFMYQARQRIDSVRYFLIGVAVLASVMINTRAEIWAQFSVAVLGGLGTIIFLRLDYRNAQIVELNAKPLRYLQRITRDRMGVSDAWVTFDVSQSERRAFASYGTLIPALYILIWLSWFCSAAIYFYRAVDGSPCRVLLTIIISAILAVIGMFGLFAGKPQIGKAVEATTSASP